MGVASNAALREGGATLHGRASSTQVAQFLTPHAIEHQQAPKQVVAKTQGLLTSVYEHLGRGSKPVLAGTEDLNALIDAICLEYSLEHNAM